MRRGAPRRSEQNQLLDEEIGKIAEFPLFLSMQVFLVSSCSGNQSEDWLIIGGGLAGALVAREALGSGVQVTICDPCPGSNSPPGGILHPYPGRRFVQNTLEGLAFAHGQGFYADLAADSVLEVKMNLPVVRPLEAPLLNAACLSGQKFDRQYRNHAEIERLWPILNVSAGAFTYNSGMVLDVRAMVNTLISGSAKAGARTIPFFATDLEKRDSGWYASGEFGEVGPFSAVVCAVGSEHCQLLSCKGASRNFGSLALYTDDRPDQDYQVIVSSGGHFAPLPGSGYVVGSTYIHLDDVGAVPVWAETDEAEHLEDVRRKLLRSHGSGAARRQLWHGSRATVPQDKQPIAGLLTSSADCGIWMIGGLASRGLFWAPWLATNLVAAILRKSNEALPTEFCPQRLKGFDRGWYEGRIVRVRH
jgi:glycine/D-amino acid oxidase-like deaminating enzyme